MSEPIKVGDLVLVKVTCNCGCGVCEGHVFHVTGVGVAYAKPYADGHPRGVSIWFSNLRRIPDFPELADERHDEEITA
jgi:hypothetical protein